MFWIQETTKHTSKINSVLKGDQSYKKKKNHIRLRENENAQNEGYRKNGAASGIALGR